MDLTRTQRLTAGTARSPHQKPRAAQRLSRLHPLQLPRQHQRRQLQPRPDPSVTPAGVLLAVFAYEPSVETLAALQHALCRAEKHNANLLAATCSTVKRWCRISETTTCSGLDTPIYTNPAVGIRCMFHCVRPHAEHRTFQLPFQRIGMNAAQKTVESLASPKPFVRSECHSSGTARQLTPQHALLWRGAMRTDFSG